MSLDWFNTELPDLQPPTTWERSARRESRTASPPSRTMTTGSRKTQGWLHHPLPTQIPPVKTQQIPVKTQRVHILSPKRHETKRHATKSFYGGHETKATRETSNKIPLSSNHWSQSSNKTNNCLILIKTRIKIKSLPGYEITVQIWQPQSIGLLLLLGSSAHREQIGCPHWNTAMPCFTISEPVWILLWVS